MPGLVGVLVALGMVVVVPLGLRRLETPGLGPLSRAWPVLGTVAAMALLLPRGPLAVLLVTPYAAACAAATACGLWRLVVAQRLTAQELAAATATTSLSVAALSLLAERAAVELLGFSLAVHGLTVAHFHYAGFAAALLAGLTASRVPSRLARAGAVGVPVGIAIVAVGHFTGRWTELGGALALTAGLLATSWVAARGVAPLLEPVGRRLMLVAACATPVTMLLAVHFALGRATGLPHLSIPETAATHGVLNALGVGLCGLLAWQRAGGARL